jgi:hypothetical protein
VPGRFSAIRRELGIAAAYLLLAAVATAPLARHGWSAVPLGGDSWVNYGNLWWVKRRCSTPTPTTSTSTP